MTEAHVLVVDDDVRLLRLLRKFLADCGFRVSEAENGLEARRLVQSIVFDIIVLDVMMPDESGLDVARDLMTTASGPILMLTALGEPEQRIEGLEIGVDEYMTKPFEPRELELRIRNLLRRRNGDGGKIEASKSRVFHFGDLVFSLDDMALTRAGQTVRLTPNEQNLLKIFCERLDQPLSRPQIGRLVGIAGGNRAVDVQIARLRRKIEKNHHEPQFLLTKRGQGYHLSTSPTKSKASDGLSEDGGELDGPKFDFGTINPQRSSKHANRGTKVL